MKATLSLLLVFQLLASSTSSTGGLRVLYEMGAFVHHFVHHVEGHHEAIGLAAFVELHYSDHHHHEEDHGEHEDLPFQHHHQSDHTPSAPAVFAVPAAADMLAFTPRVAPTVNPLICVERQWHCSAHLGAIWEPPRA